MTLANTLLWLFLFGWNKVNAELFLGSLSTRQHLVAGDVYLLSESVMEIRGFSYDGLAPAAYFWADTNPTPSTGGQILSDASPSNGCALSTDDPSLPGSFSVDQRVEFPPGLTVRDFLGGSLSVWCEAFRVDFGSIEFPDTIAESDIPTDVSTLECASAPSEVFLGSLSTIAHRVAGDVYMLSERILEIRGFTYDGAGPAAYFWADTNSNPTTRGTILSDGSPSSGCAMDVNDEPLPGATSVVQRVEFPEGVTIFDFLGGSLSVWCEAFAANFGSITFPSELLANEVPSPGPELECSENEVEVPEIAMTPEGYNCEPLNDDYQVRWRIVDDQIEIELVAEVPDDSYMAFGISGSSTRTQMVGADVVITDIPTSTGEPRARDYFMDAQAQCSGISGVCPDDNYSEYVNDISNVSGEKDSGLTLVRYTRPLVPSDVSGSSSRGESIDKSIVTTSGVETYIAWALGPISPQSGNPNFHSIGYPLFDVSLDFGRDVVNNCEPLVTVEDEVPTQAPVSPFYRPLVQDTVIEAHIGPSGGPRGYTAINEGSVSWGIAWYLNGYLIPEVVLKRNTTYTFHVNGGVDPNDDANYHPLYISTSEFGGYFQLTPEERLGEEVFAGIVPTAWDPDSGGVTDFDIEGLGPICKYETTSGTTAEVQLAGFEEFAATLDMSCAEDADLMNQAGVLTFTPDENTPDTIYYNCATHFNLGFKIHVIDADEEFTLAPTSAPTVSGLRDDFEVIDLEENLEGSQLLYKFNEKDSRAGGLDTITVIFEAPVEAWVGWGVSDNGGFMAGSEAVIGLPETGEVLKYSLGARSPAGVTPMAEEKQTLMETSIRQSNGLTTMIFTKILEEEDEIPINKSGDNTFLAAWGQSDILSFHASRGSFTASGQTLTVRKQSLWKVHGWFAALAWALLSPMAVASSVLRQFLPGQGLWFKIHRCLNTFVVLFTVIAFVTAVIAINQETPSGSSASHFDSNASMGHRTIGLFLFIFACLQAIGGMLRPHAPTTPSSPGSDEENDKKESPMEEEKTAIRSIWEICHRLLGLGLLGLSWYQVQLGIKTYVDIFGGDSTAALAVLWSVIGILASSIVMGYAMKLTSQ
eukprot:Nitzschia sp. Nitz4//scaffold34_size148208//9904//13263//NITZ4_002957-RA/size148208-augustus-gene-0.67-mRNA-1//-1//CDS//3329548726//9261//frame0